MEQKTVTITNPLGLHLRAAGTLVKVAGAFQSDVWIEFAGHKANGKSILSVISLAAGAGSSLSVQVEGSDAKKAIKAVVQVIEAGFLE